MAHFKKNCPLGLNLTRIHNRLLIYNHPCCSSRPEACTAAPTSSSTRLRRDCCSKGGLWWERRSGDGFGRVLQFSFQSCWSLQLSWPLVYTSPTAGRPLSWQPKSSRSKAMLTVGGSNAVWLVSSFTSLYSTAALNTSNSIFFFLVKSSLVELETSAIQWSFP